MPVKFKENINEIYEEVKYIFFMVGALPSSLYTPITILFPLQSKQKVLFFLFSFETNVM